VACLSLPLFSNTHLQPRLSPLAQPTSSIGRSQHQRFCFPKLSLFLFSLHCQSCVEYLKLMNRSIGHACSSERPFHAKPVHCKLYAGNDRRERLLSFQNSFLAQRCTCTKQRQKQFDLGIGVSSAKGIASSSKHRYLWSVGRAKKNGGQRVRAEQEWRDFLCCTVLYLVLNKHAWPFVESPICKHMGSPLSFFVESGQGTLNDLRSFGFSPLCCCSLEW